MASEDIFEDCSEEIITQLDNEYVNNDLDLEQIPSELDQAKNQEVNTDTNNVQTGEPPGLLNTSEDNRASKLFQLPLAKIRNLMKLDPDLHIASNEAVFITTRATELFIESLSRESYLYTTQSKKKTIQKRDVDLAISAIDSLMFLDGALGT